MKRALRKLALALTTMAAFALMTGTSFALTQDFEAGNTGFTSAYTYHALAGSDPDSSYGLPYGLYEEGYYTVGSSPGSYHTLWANFGAHSGLQMMIVNGVTTPNVPVWASLPNSIAVTPGQQYSFSAWLTSVYPEVGASPISPANLAFSINGTQINGDFTLSSPVGTWQQFSTLWTADANFANISIINGNTNYDGNDFAIDDITLNPVPEPGTVLLLGVGMIGVVLGKRRMSKAA